MKLNEIKILDQDVDFSVVQGYIDFVVSSVLDADGNYHEYLRDYTEAIALITMYTDYGSTNFNVNEVMAFILTDKWCYILDELGKKYTRFHNYIQKEIEYNNTPLRSFDKTIKGIQTLINDLDGVIKSINVDAIKNYDFSKLINAIDAVNNTETQKTGKSSKPEIKLVKDEQ